MMVNIMQMMQMIRGSRNPQQTMIQMAQQNPGLNQAMQMVNGKTPDQMRQMAMQMAQQRGVDLNALAAQMGIQLPR